jgi:hypothetical protein
MKHFEYEITRHPSDDFSQLVYFCTDSGECNLNQIPSDQIKMLGDILNDRGADGWELIQLLFGREGIIALWKREAR